jgi:hypothetical protein
MSWPNELGKLFIPIKIQVLPIDEYLIIFSILLSLITLKYKKTKVYENHFCVDDHIDYLVTYH